MTHLRHFHGLPVAVLRTETYQETGESVNDCVAFSSSHRNVLDGKGSVVMTYVHRAVCHFLHGAVRGRDDVTICIDAIRCFVEAPYAVDYSCYWLADLPRFIAVVVNEQWAS